MTTLSNYTIYDKTLWGYQKDKKVNWYKILQNNITSVISKIVYSGRPSKINYACVKKVYVYIIIVFFDMDIFTEQFILQINDKVTTNY